MRCSIRARILGNWLDGYSSLMLQSGMFGEISENLLGTVSGISHGTCIYVGGQIAYDYDTIFFHFWPLGGAHGVSSLAHGPPGSPSLSSAIPSCPIVPWKLRNIWVYSKILWPFQIWNMWFHVFCLPHQRSECRRIALDDQTFGDGSDVHLWTSHGHCQMFRLSGAGVQRLYKCLTSKHVNTRIFRWASWFSWSTCV